MGITFITGNKSKAEQVARMVQYPLLFKRIDLPEIQSLDIEEIARIKAESAYTLLQAPVLIDDVSLYFHAMGKVPGPFVKWFVKESGTEGLCRMLDGFTDRRATAYVLFTLYDGKEVRIFTGETSGRIADHPISTNGIGFGWDAVFIPDGYTQTRGEMSLEDYDATSPRLKALEKLEAYLKTI